MADAHTLLRFQPQHAPGCFARDRRIQPPVAREVRGCGFILCASVKQKGRTPPPSFGERAAGLIEALEGLVTSPRRIALEIVADLAVRTDGFKGVLAPKGAIVGMLNGGIPFRFDEHSLPAQHRATVHADLRKAGAFHRLMPLLWPLPE